MAGQYITNPHGHHQTLQFDGMGIPQDYQPLTAFPAKPDVAGTIFTGLYAEADGRVVIRTHGSDTPRDIAIFTGIPFVCGIKEVVSTTVVGNLFGIY